MRKAFVALMVILSVSLVAGTALAYRDNIGGVGVNSIKPTIDRPILPLEK